MKKTVLEILIAILAIFAPASQMVLAVLGLCLTDLGTGIWAKTYGQTITSTGLKRTVLKVVVYEVCILCAFVVQKYLAGPFIPVLNICSSLIGLTELKSILENLDIVYGGSFFGAMISKLNKLTSYGDDSESK